MNSPQTHTLRPFSSFLRQLWLAVFGLTFLPAGAFGFSLFSTKHDNSQPIPYYINLGAYVSAANRADMILGIRNAFKHVEDNPYIEVTFQYMGETTTLPANDTMSVIYVDSDRTYVPGAGVTFNYNTNATTGRTISADIALNGQTHGSAPLTNLYALTLHELCHFLGLGHSLSGSDSAVAANTVQMNLAQDDIAGLATLYPNPARPLSAEFGTVRGRVLDAAGAGFRARIVAYNSSRTQPRVVTVDCSADGRYELPGLPAGTYQFIAETYATPFIHTYTQQGQSQVVSAGSLLENRDVNLITSSLPRLNTSGMEEVVIHPVSGQIYATGGVYGPIYVIDPQTGTRLASLAIKADDLAFTKDGSKLVVVSQIDRRVAIVDTVAGSPTRHTVVSQVSDTPSQPIGVAVRGNETAYVSCNGGGCVLAVDLQTSTLSATIVTNEYNQEISISPDGSRALLGTYIGTSNWIEIDIVPGSPTLNTIVRKFSAGSNSAWRVIAAADGERVFIGTRSGVDVRRRSDNTLLAQIPGGRGTLTTLALTPSGRHLAFVGWDFNDLRNNQLRLIDTTTLALVDQVTIGGDIHYVGNGTSSSSFLVSGTSGLFTIRPAALSPDSLVGLTPSAGTLSPAFVSSTLGYAVQVPHMTSSIRFTPAAADDSATITVNGTPVVSGQPSQDISLVPGENAVAIVVTPPGGGQSRTYSVNVHRRHAPLLVVDDAAGGPLAGGGVRSFDPTAVGETSTMTFTLRNAGAGSLDDLAISMSGADASHFTLDVQGIPSSIAASASAQFSVRFRPTATGPREITVNIQSNDSGAPLAFHLEGRGVRQLPAVVTLAVSTVLTDAATLNATVNAEGDEREVVFDYGMTTSFGLTVNAEPSVVSGSGPVSAEIGGLLPHTRYYFRVRAFSALGSASGSTLSFITGNTPPVAVPDTVSALPGSSITLPILANDGDPDGDTISLASHTALFPANTGKLVRSGNDLVFTAPPGFSGAAFSYVIKDSQGAVSAEARVLLTLGSATVEPAMIEKPSAGTTYPVTITADGAWTVSESLSWVSVSPTAGLGDDSVMVTLLPNTSPMPRSGSLFIGGREHRITQNPAARPEISAPGEVPAAMVSADYSLVIPTVGLPVTYAVTNLPPGLRLDGNTGVLSGRPTKAGSYPMNIRARNSQGAASTAVDFTLQVLALPENFIGTFHGFVERDESLNASLGSRLELTTSSIGAVSGRLITGGSRLAFTGRLLVDMHDADHPQAIISIPVPRQSPIELSVTFDRESRTLAGHLSDDTGLTVPVEAWKNPWHAKNKVPAYYRRLHSFVMEPGNDDPAIPQGHGFGVLGKIPEATGVVTLAGKLADGSTFTTSTHLGPQGQVLLYQSLYSNRGSLAGRITLTSHDDETPDNAISGLPTWFKPASAGSKDTLYAAGFEPVPLMVHGGAYPVPGTGGLVLGLTASANAADLIFTHGGLEVEGLEFSQRLVITASKATATTPIAHSTRITALNPATGIFSGEFTLPGASAALNRKVSFQGQIVNGINGLMGQGFFILPESKAAMAPRLSGRVILMPAE